MEYSWEFLSSTETMPMAQVKTIHRDARNGRAGRANDNCDRYSLSLTHRCHQGTLESLSELSSRCDRMNNSYTNSKWRSEKQFVPSPRHFDWITPLTLGHLIAMIHQPLHPKDPLQQRLAVMARDKKLNEQLQQLHNDVTNVCKQIV